MKEKREILALKNIRVAYEKGKPALDGVSLTLRQGEILGIRGENGAGKTTLMGVMAGTLRPSEGSRETARELDGRITLVPQEVALYPTLTGKQNLEFWAEIYGLKGREKEERIRFLLERTRLLDKAGKKVETYSGGMKRRLNLAAALVIEPMLLLLDEPTVGMDAGSVREMYLWLRELKDRGTSIVLISHESGEAETICDRIIRLSDGKAAEEKE